MGSIWHTPPEQPDPFKSWSVLVVYEANDRKEMMYSTQFIHATDGMYVNRWCYLDDLLALETELERTRKALEVAKDTIIHADWFFDGDYNIDAKTMHNEIKCAIKAITAPEQKDTK